MFGGLLGVVGLDVLWFLVRLALPVEMERHASAKALRAHRRPHCFAELYAVEAEVSRYDIQPGATLPTIGTALIAPIAFVGIAFLEGHFITPTIIGRRLALNALAVLLALAFWSWLWGPMGAFLSAPLLIVALVLKEHLVEEDSPQLPAT